ncbi:WGxxGxxG family protein [Paenibacillus sp. 1P07SE]|uniref:WGxxGxxG family protein n=1 Tax=Paenibacillus sp. 1P07SE TaxID=3132209 RepID=UPI0039A40929
MKRLSLSFLIVASLMLMLAVPTFAESSNKMMKQSNTGVELNNTTQRTSMDGSMRGNTMNRGAGMNGFTQGNRVQSDNNFGAYGMDNGRYRTTAANNDRMDWGWLGLLGLIGLAGLRGRNREAH